MTRAELEVEWTTRDGVIRNPGKFEGEPLYVPYFWNVVLDGCSDDEYNDAGDILSSIDIEDEDRGEFPELGNATRIVLWESDQGFVYHSLED